MKMPEPLAIALTAFDGWKTELRHASASVANTASSFEARSKAEEHLTQSCLILGMAVVDRASDATFLSRLVGLWNEDPTPRVTVTVPTACPTAVEPPVAEPPKVEPPAVEIPKAEPPVVEPPKVEVPVAEPPVAEPPKVEITSDVLERLSESLTSGRALLEEEKYEPPFEMLEEAVQAFGPAPQTVTDLSCVTECSRMIGIARDLLDKWATLPSVYNLLLTGWLTARVRHVQSLVAARGLDRSWMIQVESAIRHLSAHSKATRPGFVYGLALDHQPQYGTWFADAAVWEKNVLEALTSIQPPPPPSLDDRLRILTEKVRDQAEISFVAEVKSLIRDGLSATDPRLVNLARPFALSLDGKPLAPLRKAIRDAVEVDAEEDEATSNNWPSLPKTKGKRVVIVGGDPRPDRAEKLKATFEFATLEWLDGSTVRKVQPLVTRMKNGSVDLVLVLRAFNSHRLTDAIFAADAPTCQIVLTDGYGVTQVRLGLERFLKD